MVFYQRPFVGTFVHSRIFRDCVRNRANGGYFPPCTVSAHVHVLAGCAEVTLGICFCRGKTPCWNRDGPHALRESQGVTSQATHPVLAFSF